jgi:hypothetical protein
MGHLVYVSKLAYFAKVMGHTHKRFITMLPKFSPSKTYSIPLISHTHAKPVSGMIGFERKVQVFVAMV